MWLEEFVTMKATSQHNQERGMRSTKTAMVIVLVVMHVGGPFSEEIVHISV